MISLRAARVPGPTAGAFLLYEALKGSGKLTPALDMPELAGLGNEVYTLLEERTAAELAGPGAARDT